MTRPPTSDNQTLPPIMVLLRRQHGLLERLHQLSDRQHELIVEGHSDSVVSLLSQRQELIDQLRAVGGKIEPYRARWADTRTSLPASVLEQADRLVDRAAALFEAMLDRDDQDQRHLQEARTQISRKLVEANSASQAIRAYHGPTRQGSSRFTNRQG